MTSPKYLLTSESVTEGHPDKLCDQISDAVLDAALSGDKMSRVACETVATKNLVMVTGEITTGSNLDFNEIARQVMKDIGYTDVKYGLDGNSCGVIAHVSQQSPDISSGVTTSGAGDQGMMVGFACNETEELMPLTVDLSHRLVEQLSKVRKDGVLPYLGPDGKSQVTVEYRHGRPHRVDAVVISTQHEDQNDREAFTKQLRKDIRQHVIDPIAGEYMDDDTKIYVNPSGWFVVGGPQGDTGLTGRKILVDTYGGIARHGGGAFSGKDPTKVDRSGAYAARYVAKNLVAAGLADRVEVIVSYAIGVAEPISVSVETFDTNHLDNDRIEDLVRENFDLRPGAIIEDLSLRQPIYRQTAAYGHFGRSDMDLPWERTDKAEMLRKKAGL
ncbi:S-adenosylmethionine synthase [Geodia barretti]|uniref:S-adenosylmethionine synthase n=1 Tax=Geodia barretti TaxID=519541 RepID=A0AA35WTY6_GEOBA|nr:S-adenosylmethionine synthase [Geodia barretti]